MTKEKKYFANLEKLKEVTSELEFKSSYYDDTVKDLNLDFRGMSHKYFSLLKQGKKAFEISIYEKLARVFNKLYIEEHRKGKTEKKTIDASDLYVDKENANSKKLEKTIYLERLDDYFDFGAFGEQPKIIQNFARITQGSARLIDEFISSIDDQVKRQDEFKDTFYSEDEQLKKILDHEYQYENQHLGHYLLIICCNLSYRKIHVPFPPWAKTLSVLVVYMCTCTSW